MNGPFYAILFYSWHGELLHGFKLTANFIVDGGFKWGKVHFMTPKQIHLVTLVLFIIDVPLMCGDKYLPFPLPAWLTGAWPAILFAAGILDKALRIYFSDVPLPKPPVTPLVPAPVVTNKP